MSSTQREKLQSAQFEHHQNPGKLHNPDFNLNLHP